MSDDKFGEDFEGATVTKNGGNILTSEEMADAKKMLEDGEDIDDVSFKMGLRVARREAEGEHSFGGPGSGWHREQGHVSHKHKDEKAVLKPSKERAFSGEAQPGPRLSKLETGALGESLATLYLKQMGYKDARTLNTKGNNFAVDLVQDHHVYEVKAGLASNSLSAQQWRATIGQPGPKEAKWLARASDSAKAKWNDRKMSEILQRKENAVKQVSKVLGKKVKGKTLALVINAEKRIVDIHEFDGFHLRIGWKSDQAKSGYKGSFRY